MNTICRVVVGHPIYMYLWYVMFHAIQPLLKLKGIFC